RRNLSWTTDGKNDPIMQVTNEGEKSISLTLRLLIGDSSYRYPTQVEIPAGENRFIRIQEVLGRISEKYPEVKNATSGSLQIEFEGVDSDVKTQTVNLNPKAGIVSNTEQARSPSITAVEPNSGNPGGGTVVTLEGQNFDDSTAVKFGGLSALRNRQSDDTIIAVAPPHSPGVVDIEVSNGKKTARLSKAFRYEFDPPLITKLDPDTGPSRGGTKVIIQGKNFQPGATVRWNDAVIPSRFQSPESISILSSAGKTGSVTVVVTNPDGKNVSLPDAFNYKGVPEVRSVSPKMGPTAGGYTVTVTGNNFQQGSSVLFGTQYGQTTFINPTVLAAIAPAGESGVVDITVSNPDGEMNVLPNAFIYNEPPRISNILAAPNPIVRNTVSTITVQASDPEVGPLQYEYRVAQGPPGCTVQGQGEEAIFHSGNVLGTAIVQVTVYDEYDAKAQGTITIVID
ncbi:MAG: hypothetical protein C5B54_02960, partial [Acidobacteria bacterium]